VEEAAYGCSFYWIYWRIMGLNLPENSDFAVQREILDSKDRERAPNPPGLMENLVASLPEAVAIVRNNRVFYINPAFTRIFGFTIDEISGGNLRDFIVPDMRQHEYALMQKAVDQNGSTSLDTVRRSKQGELLDVALLVGPLVVNGEKAGYVFCYRENGARKQIEAKLQHDAMHDALTGLPNRALFLDRLTLALSRRSRRRREQNCGVYFLDLDRFKEINDTLGHAAGDQLLITVAERLCAALRPQDTAARLGGDEFAVLVENIQSISELEIVANRILREMARPFEISGHTLQASASIGVAMAAPVHTVPEMLIRDADFAMYRAKQAGGGRYEIFDKRLEVHVNNMQERERELRHVLDKREFEIWYQPIYRLGNGKIEGFESLLRWRRSNGSVDSLGELLPVAEETGLSISLGRETMEAVCRQLRSWTRALPQADLTLTVNLSQRQFYHSDLVAQMKRALAATGADPARLLVEVEESTLTESPEMASAILQRIVDCSLRVAVDNFGSGLAPLNHLVQLPIDVLKLDPKLTLSATSTGRQVAVLESLIRLGAALGVQVVAQGIESSAQLEALRCMNCELGQGPLLSQALEPEQALECAKQGFWKAGLLDGWAS
jgi:diguanylate cyclase (GGDEF)-like protein/PAS domain S-box-containing protein